ncbi:MAG: alpha/beta hydrolase [Deltaproteobacteria bacterium]|nr:alpha/beta hydrolase [Deltaproteobacteria bacterium]
MSRTMPLAALLCLSGCGLFFRAPAPIPWISYPGAGDPSGRDLLLLLPGRGDRAQSFADEGVVAIARHASAKLDVVAVDATTGYYIHRNLCERLMADVIEPARPRGYCGRCISGISQGGLGALLFAQFHPQEVSDVIAIAPFLGDEDVLDEIESAGGVTGWRPPSNLHPDDYQRALWRWLRSCTVERQPCPRIFLGFGAEDRFARAHRLLASVLPPGQVAVVPGGHTWDPWRQLYAALLPRVARK